MCQNKSSLRALVPMLSFNDLPKLIILHITIDQAIFHGYCQNHRFLETRNQLILLEVVFEKLHKFRVDLHPICTHLQSNENPDYFGRGFLLRLDKTCNFLIIILHQHIQPFFSPSECYS